MSRLMEMLIRRGFLWQSFEIYGGIAGFIDFAPLGNRVRRNLEKIWRDYFVINERSVEIDTPTIGIKDVFAASGHLSSFTDVALECRNCGRVFRADHYINEKLGIESDETMEAITEILDSYDLKCECRNDFKDPEYFNLMFATTIGLGNSKKGYLRPETAQGIFINFKRLKEYFRGQLPFGVCQVGRVYRNEISPRQGVIRLREFNQAEMEYFVHPEGKTHSNFSKYQNMTVTLEDKWENEYNITLGEALARGILPHELLAYYIGKTKQYLLEVGISEDKLKFRQHKDDERAHYAADTWDAEALTEYGWIELVGIADRTDYDLKRHAEVSGEDMSVFVQYSQPQKVKTKRLIPLMNKLGPQFRDKAKAIASKIENYHGDVGESIEVEVDGEVFEISNEFFEVEDVEEEIHGERIIPHVIEPSFGLDRIVYSILEHSFNTDTVAGEERKLLRLQKKIAPVQIAVLPLLTKEDFLDVSQEIISSLKEIGIHTEYDTSGSIGRRYRRYDEIGTPFCITVDKQTLQDRTVTIRDRDTTEQVRVSIDKLQRTAEELLYTDKSIYEVGSKPK